MLKIASSSLGMGPQHAMSTAEHLYLSGYLTYPRTESTSYPKNFDFREIVDKMNRSGSPMAKYAGYLLEDGIV
jgi:DNA topoisomerase III